MALVMVLRSVGGKYGRHAMLSHTPGPTGASLAQGSWQVEWLQRWCLLVALSVVHPELELCSVRDQAGCSLMRGRKRGGRGFMCVWEVGDTYQTLLYSVAWASKKYLDS